MSKKQVMTIEDAEVKFYRTRIVLVKFFKVLLWTVGSAVATYGLTKVLKKVPTTADFALVTALVNSSLAAVADIAGQARRNQAPKI
jgi:hypothetical protein